MTAGSAGDAGVRAAPAKRKPGAGRRDPPPPSRPGAVVRAAPSAPWAPFPLVELAILIGLVLAGAGLLTGGPRGPVLLGCGLGLASLAGLELTVREHFAGYRSHASVLAGAGAVGVAAVLYAFTALPQPLPLVISAGVFGGLWSRLRAAYRRARGAVTPPPA